MLHFASPVTLRLERGRLLVWKRQSPVRLRVVAGTAWVTQADDMQDHFLQPGQTLELRAASHAVISAEHDVSLSFEAEGSLAGALLRRVRAALAGRRGERRPAVALGAA